MNDIFRAPYERDFVQGRRYAIEEKNNVFYVYEYLRKDGIHHCFKSIRSNWTRTFTDYQLIGKKVEEVL